MKRPGAPEALRDGNAGWLLVGMATVALAIPATATTAAAAGGGGVRATQAGPDDQPLEAAGRAAAELSFVGVLQVRWSDGKTNQHGTLLVQGGNGVVVVRGDKAVMASPQQRLVEHAGGAWDLLWPVAQAGVGGANAPAGAGRPSPARKYQFQYLTGPPVSGRTTRLVEVRDAGAVLERLYLDDQTSLLLRREQFEGGEGPSRTVEFESIAIGGPIPAPDPPGDVVNLSPKMVPAGHVPGGVSAPLALADGYQRLGLYRRTGVVQVLYSDGLYDLSVFQQQGRLDHHGLPAASRVQVGDGKGWHYAWAGGHVVLWEGHGTVYTAVSDAPLGQILTAIRSLPLAGVSTPLLTRLRQACRALIQPFGA